MFGDDINRSDAGWAKAPRGRASGASPIGFLVLLEKEFKSKLLRERDKDLLNIEERSYFTDKVGISPLR